MERGGMTLGFSASGTIQDSADEWERAVEVMEVAPVCARLAAVAPGRTAAAPPIPHIGMRGFSDPPMPDSHRQGRSGLARSSATHISTAVPQCRFFHHSDASVSIPCQPRKTKSGKATSRL